MGLDVQIRLTKPIVCPDCGKIVYNAAIDEYPYNEVLHTGGHCLRAYLNEIGYGDEQYDKWVQLTTEQALDFAKLCIKEACYNANEISAMVMCAMAKEYDVELEADW